MQVSGELPSVNFRLSDITLIGVIGLVKSIKIPTGPEVTFHEIQQIRVSQSHLLSVVSVRLKAVSAVVTNLSPSARPPRRTALENR